MLPIVAVTVHRDGALVTRRGVVPCAEGTAVVRGLPLLLDGSTLRARGSAPIHSLRHRLDLEDASRTTAPADAEVLARLQADLTEAEVELRLVREQQERLRSLRPTLPDDVHADAAVLDVWAELPQALRPWRADLQRRDATLVAGMARLREELAVLQERASQASSEAAWRHWSPTRLVELQVDVPDGELEVELSYRVRGATWTPAYALHTDARYRRGLFVLRALVAQDTGEDWRGVSLTLATSSCERTVDLPELPSLRLGTAQPDRPSPWRPLPADLDRLFPADLGAAPQPSSLTMLALPSTVLDVDSKDDGPALPEEKSRYWSRDRAKVELAEEEEEDLEDYAVGAAPPPSMMASPATMTGGAPPSPKHKHKRKAKPRGRASIQPHGGAAPGSGSGRRRAPPPEVEVRGDLLDYPSLRLAGWGDPSQRRGHLYAVSLELEVREAQLPATAAAWVLDRLRRAQERAQRASGLALPPHHTLPGPVEGADFAFPPRADTEIPSDGRWHSVALDSEEIELDVRLRTVPRMQLKAYRTVVATLGGRSHPLPPGPVDVIVDGAHTLSAPWRGSPGGGRLEVGLGVEDGLKITRNVRYHDESAGLFGGGRRLHTEVEVELASSLSRAVQVEVLDRVPVSSEDDVRVELVDSQPPAAEFKGDPDGPVLEGGLRQEVPLPAGGQLRTTLHYTVTLAGRLELAGGDRRG